ncbi:ADP-ribosylglycohydrolase family protein [Streptomyces otsuchiensis]|uniref:ADP-ribosylglycohydrolase family protein n=1 Tax=Streptomyces otsuchiensis TaxID=2681388 RepID=UPI00103051DF|nr:ADP-ribosylglycohydrolase family protein [Streptomyces otsuchiensis]
MAAPVTDDSERRLRALAALRGLAVGDALGASVTRAAVPGAVRRGELPGGLWRWTDDTQLAGCVLRVLSDHGRIEQDALASEFALRYDPCRDYGRSAAELLERFGAGGRWNVEAPALFAGAGSWGSGAAMRVAPLGAWFAGRPERVAAEAERSAVVTHTHPEAVAGAVAVAAATAFAAAGEHRPEVLLMAVAEQLPRTAMRGAVRRAADLLDFADVATVAAVLGSGRRTTAHDTVPFALWAAARHLDDFRAAVWSCLRAGGDIDTTAAMAGGIVAAAGLSAPPAEWAARVEPLPTWTG